MNTAQPAEISVTELKKRLDAGEELFILDIREPHELQVAAINHTAHIPMGELPSRFEELADLKEKEFVVMCRSGARSQRCVDFLQSRGYQKALNLSGGILAWSDLVDPTVPKY